MQNDMIYQALLSSRMPDFLLLKNIKYKCATQQQWNSNTTAGTITKKIFRKSISILTGILFLLQPGAFSQDVNILLKEAVNFEKQLKEPEALKKYKQVVEADAKNMVAVIKCAELSCSIGGREKDKTSKRLYYETALAYGQKALWLNEGNADANYVAALAFGKLTELDYENKKVVDYVRQIKLYADRALAINAKHAKANYVEGKWHIAVQNLSWFKKAAVKTMYGGLPDSGLDSAIYFMEKCRSADMYFVLNYLDLAKAYDQNNQPGKAIDILKKMITLPERTADDMALKEEGKKLLEKMQ